MNVKILQAVNYNGEVLEVGEEYDIETSFALGLISSNRAVSAEPIPTTTPTLPVGLLFANRTNPTVTGTGPINVLSTGFMQGIGTRTLKGGSLKQGQAVRIRACGSHSVADENADATFSLTLGGTEVLPVAVAARPETTSPRFWEFSAELSFHAVGENGSVFAQGRAFFVKDDGSAKHSGEVGGSTSLDTNADLGIGLLCGISASGNPFTVTNVTIELLG